METTMETIATELATKADQVGTLSKTHGEAIDTQSEAEVALLTRLVEKLRPALPALTSRIKAESLTRWHDNAYTATTCRNWDGPDGVCVAGDGPVDDHPRDNAGRTTGWRLYLLENEGWLEVDYDGTWSRWQGASYGWKATCKVIDAARALEIAHIDDVLAALGKALDAHLKGNLAANTAKALARAEQLRAVLALIK